MSRQFKSLMLALLFGTLVAVVSTLPLWRDLGDAGDFLLLFSLPGAIVALPLGAMGLVGNAHDPNFVVMAMVDDIVYTWLFYWLMSRRLPREPKV
ncbi:MAG: hypothetical protein WB439_01915 [Acidobacteriaceae bacterium]